MAPQRRTRTDNGNSNGTVIRKRSKPAPANNSSDPIIQQKSDFSTAQSKNPFVFGNQFWKLRSSHGAHPKFDTPEKLWDACCEYFEMEDANPLVEERVASAGGFPSYVYVAHPAVYTLSGLCVFLGITQVTWCAWRKDREDLSKVIGMVDEIVRTQKFKGAAAGFFNANIIARDLGLADKRELTSPDGSMTPRITQGMDPKEAADAYRQLIKDCKEGNG